MAQPLHGKRIGKPELEQCMFAPAATAEAIKEYPAVAPVLASFC